MSVAHNTITADELRQDQATGKLVAWKEGDNYVAVSASAGTAYKVADLTRSILVTDDYVLQVGRAHSTDGRPHVFDLNYHNYGKQTMQLPTTPYCGFFTGKRIYAFGPGATRRDQRQDHDAFRKRGHYPVADVLGGVPAEVFQGVLRDRILP
jgi:hypothetical protein